MRLLIFAVLVGVVAGYNHTPKSSVVSQQNVAYVKDLPAAEEPILLRIRNNSAASSATEPVKPEPTSFTAVPTTFATTFAASPPTAKPIEAEPIPEKEEKPSLTSMSDPIPEQLSPQEEVSKRRVITYDQRQEGQYNIRADLDNFMIVLIPPSPADGLNLLDLLTKSSLRRTSSKSKRKHYAAGSTSGLKYRQNLKSGLGLGHNLNFLPRGQFGAQNSPLSLVENVSVQRLPSDFIEGRTPYHVDISASDDEQSRLHPDRQVDVLPPPYPLAYQHLIKPFHLDAEPTVIQALPPSDITQAQQHASGNFLETYNQLLASSLNGQAGSESVGTEASETGNTGFYRVSRAIRPESSLDMNRVLSSNSLSRLQMPLLRPDLSYGAASVYPPIDVPRIVGYFKPVVDPENSVDTRAQELGKESLDGIFMVRESSGTEDELELDLHSGGDDFIDSEAKSLLGDINGGMERCAPGRRRDSYGICREIEGY